MSPRFGVLTFARGRFDDIAREWRAVEELGFRTGWLADALVSLRAIQDYEAWTTLAALARETSRLRIGTLVTIAPLRHPALLAGMALTLDHVSSGRLELGIGPGEYGADNVAVGMAEWTPRERFVHLEEQVGILDRLLRGERLEHTGAFYRSTAQFSPPLQRPRPPIVIAAQGPKGLRLAARVADGWNTLGGQPPRPAEPASLAEAVARTREQVDRLEAYCGELGRDPATLRRSVLAFRAPFDPVSSLDAFDEFVGPYAELGLDEFVFYWPPIANVRTGEPISPAQRSALERIAAARVRASG